MINKKLKFALSRWLPIAAEKTPAVVPRRSHHLSRKKISPQALKVLYRLKEAGFKACLVGGGVRDVLLNRPPKDFDVATDATPEAVRRLFKNSRVIGRRFRLVHVFFHEEIIEVSTFRGTLESAEEPEDTTTGLIKADNTYGTMEEDAWRRDFTVNALFYNIADFSIIDYTRGLPDLKARVIRMIGDPVQRYHEDPVRLLRAIRLSAKLEFTMHPETEAPLGALSHLLQHVPPSRLFDELLKLFFDGYAALTYAALKQYDYLGVLFPPTQAAIEARGCHYDQQLIVLAMEATDTRFYDGRSLNPGFLLSVVLWPAVQHRLETEKSRFRHFYQLLHFVIDQVVLEQNKTVYIPKRLVAMIRSVWLIQYQLIRRRPSRVYRVLKHRYFRAAFDFLSLRAASGEEYDKLVDWWAHIQKVSSTERASMIQALGSKT